MEDETGIDFQTDTSDGGLHMNVFGAEKLSVWLGDILTENTQNTDNKYNLTDYRNNPKAVEEWAEKSEKYHTLKEIQLNEFDTYGKVLTHTYE
jgi:hypothetical protein